MPATLIRQTGTWEFDVDDEVARRGHKACKGWQLSGTEDVYCLRCGVFLFPLAEVVSR